MTTRPEEIFAEYRRAEQYDQNLDLYETVRRNEDFYIGEQWKGVVAPDLEKPVLNFLHRVVAYFCAMIVSDDVAISIRPFAAGEQGERLAEVLAAEVEQVFERTKAKAKNREIVRDMAVDGDGCAHFWFDPQAETGQTARGEIRMEVVENTKLLFADPYHPEVQEQPYLLLVRRSRLETIRERARENGAPDYESIRPDSSSLYVNEENDPDGALVTSVVKYWKAPGRTVDPLTGQPAEGPDTVRFIEVTGDTVVQPETDTGCRLYPFAWANWERVKNSYHGRAAITGLIPNQVFVNKLWAMAMEQVKRNAFPKVIYNRSMLGAGRWSNRVGEAVGVDGNPNEAIASGWRAPDMSAQVLEMVDRTVSLTRDFMGASDAALGNVKPDNTSAIIAVQKASSAPLELQRMAFYQFVEDCARIVVDMIHARYGARWVQLEDGSGRTVTAPVDFSAGSIDAMELNVDVGESSYWSELMQIQTLDNLFAKGIVTDATTYLEGIPEKYIPQKKKLLEELRRRKELMQDGDRAAGALSVLQGGGVGQPVGGQPLA